MTSDGKDFKLFVFVSCGTNPLEPKAYRQEARGLRGQHSLPTMEKCSKASLFGKIHP